MKRLRDLTFCMLFFAALCLAYKFPRPTNYQCGKLSATALLLAKSGFAYLGTGASDGGTATSIYINMKTRDWLFLTSDMNLRACITTRGTDFQFALDPS